MPGTVLSDSTHGPGRAVPPRESEGTVPGTVPVLSDSTHGPGRAVTPRESEGTVPGYVLPSPREIRESLPRGWVLDADGKTARRDARVLFREGWMLLLCLACFAAAAGGLFWWSFPRGVAGWIRLAVALLVLLLAGGFAAPILTRALSRSPGRNRQ